MEKLDPGYIGQKLVARFVADDIEKGLKSKDPDKIHFALELLLKLRESYASGSGNSGSSLAILQARGIIEDLV